MLNLTPQGQTLVQETAARYDVSQDAVLTALQALIHGGGRGAQFTHPDLGGHVQWLAGGMTMAGGMNAHTLKAKINGLCTDLAAALAAHPEQADAGDGNAIYLPDAARVTGHWWPFSLGAPSASGSQNAISYAYFPDARRLAIEIKGHVTVYDTRDYQISGLGQQQGDEASLTLISQKGDVRLNELPVVQSSAHDPEPPAAPQTVPNAASPATDGMGNAASAAMQNAEDVLRTIEGLAALKDKGVLTTEEFVAKKAELLGRI